MRFYEEFCRMLDCEKARWSIDQLDIARRYFYNRLIFLPAPADSLLFINYYGNCIRRDLQADLRAKVLSAEEFLESEIPDFRIAALYEAACQKQDIEADLCPKSS